MISATEVRKYGGKLGLDVIRVASAKPFPEYAKFVQNRIENELIPTESQDAEESRKHNTNSCCMCHQKDWRLKFKTAFNGGTP